MTTEPSSPKRPSEVCLSRQDVETFLALTERGTLRKMTLNDWEFLRNRIRAALAKGHDEPGVTP